VLDAKPSPGRKFLMAGKSRNVTVIGKGKSQLDDFLAAALKKEGRVAEADPMQQNGYYYRSDHFSLVKAGVPMLYANSGNDFIGRTARYRNMVEEDAKNRYHTPNDVINRYWNWQGLDQNLWLFYYVGHELANSQVWPQWNETGEFRSIREATDFLRVRKEEP